jgi:hypothetical protein
MSRPSRRFLVSRPVVARSRVCTLGGLLAALFALACGPVETPERTLPGGAPAPGTRAAPAVVLAPMDWDAGPAPEPEPPPAPLPAPADTATDDVAPVVGVPYRLAPAMPPAPLALVSTTEGALLFMSRPDASGLVETAALPLTPDGRPRGEALPVARRPGPVVALTAVRHWRAGRILLALTDDGGRVLLQVDEEGGLVAPVAALPPDGDPGAPPALARRPDGFAVASTHSGVPDTIRLDRPVLAPGSSPVGVAQTLTCADAEVLDLAFTGEALWLAARCAGRPWLINPDAGSVRRLDGDAEAVRLLADGYGLVEVARTGKAGESGRIEARRLGGDAEQTGPFRLLAKTNATAELIVALRPVGGLGLVLGAVGGGRVARVLRVDADLYPEGHAFALPEGFTPAAAVWRRDGGLVCGHMTDASDRGEVESLVCVAVPP